MSQPVMRYFRRTLREWIVCIVLYYMLQEERESERERLNDEIIMLN